MRPKKDPGIRREQFIEAAAGLFLQHGYADVSVKAVLDAVGDRTASPSVFYYYFADKDELYRAAVEKIANSYVDGFDEAFADTGLSPDAQLMALVQIMHKSLAKNRKLTLTDISRKNRSFILDMKEQVTASFAKMWECFLLQSGLLKDRDPGRLALFLAGGISAMIMAYMTQDVRNEEAEQTLVKDIVLFSASALGLNETERQMFLQRIEQGDVK